MFEPGPLVCKGCSEAAASSSSCDIGYNRPLMYLLAVGEPHVLWTEVLASQVARSAPYFRWDGSQLWYHAGPEGVERIIPPVW